MLLPQQSDCRVKVDRCLGKTYNVRRSARAALQFHWQSDRLTATFHLISTATLALFILFSIFHFSYFLIMFYIQINHFICAILFQFALQYIATHHVCVYCYWRRVCTLFVIVLFFYFTFFLVTITTICEATVNGNFAMINTVVFLLYFFKHIKTSTIPVKSNYI